MAPNTEVKNSGPQLISLPPREKVWEREGMNYTRTNYLVPDDAWLLHGKLYDFSSYVERHPGGEDWILLGKGRDCTELFESVHALSARHPRSMLSKYEIKNHSEDIPQELFEWEEDGFYKTLISRVKTELFPKGSNYKASWGFYVKMTAIFAFSAWVFSQIYFSNHPILFATLYGMMLEVIGFSSMHDASHFAISKRPSINRWWSTIWNDWCLWGHWYWLQHHCLAHHAFTGIFWKDPDTIHAMGLIRKESASKYMPHMKNQHNYFWLVMMFLPNQHFGQVVFYHFARTSQKLFGLRIKSFPKEIEWMVAFNQALRMVSIVVHFVLPFVFLPFWSALGAIFLQWSAMGTSYFFCVAPNHDTYETHKVLKDPLTERIDWGEQQVRASADHSTSHGILDRIFTGLYGGMNYQIEHHLFPSVSHVHYGKIHKIVQRTCDDFNIPLPHYSTWWGAMMGYRKWLKVMSRKGPAKME